MNTYQHELLLKDEVCQVVGCATEVLNILGHGLLETPYENALTTEFGLRNISYQQPPRFDVVYKETIVGQFVPGLICFEELVVDTKTIDRITDHEIGQMLN